MENENVHIDHTTNYTMTDKGKEILRKRIAQDLSSYIHYKTGIRLTTNLEDVYYTREDGEDKDATFKSYLARVIKARQTCQENAEWVNISIDPTLVHHLNTPRMVQQIDVCEFVPQGTLYSLYYENSSFTLDSHNKTYHIAFQSLTDQLETAKKVVADSNAALVELRDIEQNNMYLKEQYEDQSHT